MEVCVGVSHEIRIAEIPYRYLAHRMTRRTVAFESCGGEGRGCKVGRASEKTRTRHAYMSMAGTGPNLGKLPRFAIHLALLSGVFASLAPRGPTAAHVPCSLSENEINSESQYSLLMTHQSPAQPQSCSTLTGLPRLLQWRGWYLIS
jgi:hypothetical protein